MSSKVTGQLTIMVKRTMFSKSRSDGNNIRYIARHVSQDPSYPLCVNPLWFSKNLLIGRTMFSLYTVSKFPVWEDHPKKLPLSLLKITRNFFVALNIERMLEIPVGSYQKVPKLHFHRLLTVK